MARLQARGTTERMHAWRSRVGRDVKQGAVSSLRLTATCDGLQLVTVGWKRKRIQGGLARAQHTASNGVRAWGIGEWEERDEQGKRDRLKRHRAQLGSGWRLTGGGVGCFLKSHASLSPMQTGRQATGTCRKRHTRKTGGSRTHLSGREAGSGLSESLASCTTARQEMADRGIEEGSSVCCKFELPYKGAGRKPSSTCRSSMRGRASRSSGRRRHERAKRIS